MNIRFLFFILCCTVSMFSLKAQVGIDALQPYPVSSDASLRTATISPNEFLKLPYIEDFSGPYIPVEKIDSVLIPTTTTYVYRIINLKPHGLKNGDKIRVFNPANIFTKISKPEFIGTYYVDSASTFTFDLYKDAAKNIPLSNITTDTITFNWIREPYNGYSTYPDTLGFVANDGGVFINQTMATNPPSIGVATFDGLNQKGAARGTNNVNGFADQLLSLPFNLEDYTPDDSIYMSFFWQEKSFSDAPESNNYLMLEFLDSTGKWNEVWKKTGNEVNPADTFKVEMIPLSDSKYLSDAFQYRFRSYGNITGLYDIWNIDYIYIDTGRTVTKPYIRDITFISTTTNYFKNVTSVPYKHFFALSPADRNTLIEPKDTMYVRDFLPGKGATDPLDYDETTYKPVFVLTRSTNFSDALNFSSTVDLSITTKYVMTVSDSSVLINKGAPLTVKEFYSMGNPDLHAPYDLSFNNFRATETNLFDYYSYDDGIPEATFKSSGSGIQVANKYSVLADDTITHVDFCFVRNGNGVPSNLENSSLILKVWKDDGPGGAPLTELCSLRISIHYSSTFGGYTRYALPPNILLTAGTYYVGYQQNLQNQSILHIGYDRNHSHSDKIYVTKYSEWIQFDSLNKYNPAGALMIRPVFSHNELVTDITDALLSEQKQFLIYPNPANGRIHFTGNPDYIIIRDLSGKIVLEKPLETEDNIELSGFANGLYIIELSKGLHKEQHKLIISVN